MNTSFYSKKIVIFPTYFFNLKFQGSSKAFQMLDVTTEIIVPTQVQSEPTSSFSFNTRPPNYLMLQISILF